MKKNIKNRLADDIRASLHEARDLAAGKPTKAIVHRVYPRDYDAWDRAIYWICEMLGYALCELAFKTHCWGPFAWAYRAGCWFYGRADDFDPPHPEEAAKQPSRRMGADHGSRRHAARGSSP